MKVRDVYIPNIVETKCQNNYFKTSRRMDVLTSFVKVSKYFVTAYVSVFEHSKILSSLGLFNKLAAQEAKKIQLRSNKRNL
jgi:hypothetical protein